MMDSGLFKTIRVKQIIEEVKDFKRFVFEDGHGISYEAGQYLTLVRNSNEEEVRRSYSFTSGPALNEPLSIGVKRVENGILSRILIDTIQEGDELTTIGAGGFFTLPHNLDHYSEVFFFAAGSGITPIYSLIKTLLHQYPHSKVVLIYSNASAAKTVFYHQLNQLQESYSRQFKVEFLFSNSQYLSKARLHRDLLIELISKYSDSSQEKILFYICGPESYMRLCTYTLQEEGFAKEQIRKENFITHTAKAKSVTPPDVNSRMVSIQLGKKYFEFEVSYPDSILKADKRKAITLPYSCEAGRCGNCVAKCISGNIWHSNNEVLTDDDLNKGLILTCVAHPVGGDVQLTIP